MLHILLPVAHLIMLMLEILLLQLTTIDLVLVVVLVQVKNLMAILMSLRGPTIERRLAPVCEHIIRGSIQGVWPSVGCRGGYLTQRDDRGIC